MTDDYGCKVCGKHFEEEEDLKSHGKDDHPEVQEAYPDIFDKDAKVEEPKDAEEIDLDGVPEDKWNDVVQQKVDEGKIGGFDDDRINISYDGKSVDSLDDIKKDDADEIDQQEDKPVQSHDDWQKDLDSMRDQYSGEKYNFELDDTTKYVDDPEEGDDNKDEEEEAKAEEDGGADDPLSKVADLAESYRYLSKDRRASLFESLGFGQGDSAILSGLEWNELTRPIKVEATEAYAKEEEEEVETGEDPDEKDENDAYEAVYNLEKNHSSPDYKKKAIECNKCNERFYNGRDRDVHFNEVHANEQDYQLPEECPYCGDDIKESETLDFHMQEEHGADVSSQYTQAGVAGAMADANFDALESRATPGFDTNCTDGEPHEPAESSSTGMGDTTCIKCGKTISQTSEGSGYWFNYPEDYVNWDRVINNIDEYGNVIGESRASDLKAQIKKKREFINMASFENPLNMGDDQAQLDDMEAELASLGEADESKWECLDCDSEFNDAGQHREETGHHNIIKKTAGEVEEGNPDDWEPHIDNEGNFIFRKKEKEDAKEDMPEWWDDPKKREEAEKANDERVKQMQNAEEYMLDPSTTDITQCVICGRDIDSHSNPNTDYRGMRADAPPTDHYYLGGDKGGSDDGYDFD